MACRNAAHMTMPAAEATPVLLFVFAACSILLWHRSDNLAFAIIAGGSVKPGEGVECKIKGILQVKSGLLQLASLGVYTYAAKNQVPVDL